MPDADVNIRIAATKGDTSALTSTSAEVVKVGEQAQAAAAQVEAASKALDDLAKDRPAPRIIDATLATPASGGALPGTKPGGLGVDLSHEAALAEAMAASAAAPKLSQRDEAKELIANTQQFKAELTALLNLPGDRTRQEIERITEAIGVLKANSAEARAMAAVAAEGGEALLAARLYRVSQLAEQAALVQSKVKTPKLADEEEEGGHTMRWSEAAAAKEGLRSVGMAGGFFTERMAMAVSQLGLLRIALFSVGGVIFGTVIGAFAGLVGWIAKAAAQAPQFQSGLKSLEGAASGLGAELNRTAKPVSNFFGSLAQNTMSAIAGGFDDAKAVLRGWNDGMGIAAQRSAELEDRLNMIGMAADNLAARTAALVEKMREENAALDDQIGKMDQAAAAHAQLQSAQERLHIARIDLREAQGLDPAVADRQRAKVRDDNKLNADRNDITRLAAEKEMADKQAKEDAGHVAGAKANLANLQKLLDQLKQTKIESDKETRQRLQKEADNFVMPTVNGVSLPTPEIKITDQDVAEANKDVNSKLDPKIKEVQDKITAAQKAVEMAEAQSGNTQNKSSTLGSQLQTKKTEQQADQTQAQADAAAARKREKEESDRKAKEAREKELRETIDGVAAEHTARMAGISASGQKDIEIARQRYAETMRELQARKQLEDELGKLQGEDDAQRQARLDRYTAEALNAQAQLQSAEKRDQKLQTRDAEADWRANGPKHGGIDARAQNEYDLSGNLTRHHGQDVATPPRESLQRLVQGAGDPKPGDVGQSLNHAASSIAQLATPAKDLAQHAQNTQAQIVRAHQETAAALDKIAKSSVTTNAKVQAAVAEFLRAIAEIQRNLAQVSSQQRNSR